MRNLYEKLKTEIKRAIEQRSKDIPLTMRDLIYELKNKESIFMMTYGNFLELEHIVRFHTSINPNKPLEYFVQ